MRINAVKFGATLLLVTAFALSSACAHKTYEYRSLDEFSPSDQAHSQTMDGITVEAFVPGVDQAEALFGFPIYERGIQPVWLSIHNATEHRARFAPTSLDTFYFSPLEVAYIHRKGYSKEARREMDIRLYQLAMPRIIPPGETRSGFVFTHASTGTKAFNVDVFSTDRSYRNFHFIYNVQGFTPDHSSVDFAALYRDDQIRDLDEERFREALSEVPCCTVNAKGDEQGLPVDALIIGKGKTLLSTLLRSGWEETPLELRDAPPENAQHLFGRPPDSIFRFLRKNGQLRNELRLWLTPVRIDGSAVWAAQVIQFIGHRTQLRDLVFGSVFDPDMDAARSFLVQNLWYSQGVRQIAWQSVNPRSTIDNSTTDFNGTEYFTDGLRTVLWLSDKPVSLQQVKVLDWDEMRVKE